MRWLMGPGRGERGAVPGPSASQSLASTSFAGFRFPPAVILVAVRWYLRYGLSYRDVEELLAERGVQVDHVVGMERWHQAPVSSASRAVRICRALLGFDDDPTASLQLGGERTRGHAFEQLVDSSTTWRGVYWRHAAGVLACELRCLLLELLDERVRFVAAELAGRLALGEAKWPAGVAEVGVTGGLDELQELSQLSPSGGRTPRLAECHVL